MLSNIISGGKKPSAMVSKNMRKSSTTKRTSSTSKRGTLPGNWNKDKAHLVGVKLISSDGSVKQYPGYLWATNNWVEIHCFDRIDAALQQIKGKGQYVSRGFYEDFGSVKVFRDPPPQWVEGASQLKLVPEFGQIKFSTIVARDKVKFIGRNYNDKSFGDGASFLRGGIEIQYSKDGVSRWKQWHPKNDFRRKFPELSKSTDSKEYKDYYRKLRGNSDADHWDGV